MRSTEEMAGLVDSYVRDELSPEEMAEFETAMLDSPELQTQVDTALAIQRALQLEQEFDQWPASASTREHARNHWQGLAIAAGVVLAVFSTTMYWKVSNDNASLRSELGSLRQPKGVVLTVPVDIMRSAGGQTPDVIVQKPKGNALVVLDIELSPAMGAAGKIHLVLRDLHRAVLFTLEGSRAEDGRLRVAFNADTLPYGQVWLEMSAARDGAVDRRLLEFR